MLEAFSSPFVRAGTEIADKNDDADPMAGDRPAVSEASDAPSATKAEVHPANPRVSAKETYREGKYGMNW
jgi:hypothetical protein